MLHSRIRRLETLLQRRAVPARTGAAVVWSAATCVKALRNVLLQLAAQPELEVTDPFPQREGEDYLLAFWPWLLAHGTSWPRWALAHAQRIGAVALGDVGRLSLSSLTALAGRSLQTPQDVIDLLKEQIEAVRGEDLDGTLPKARIIGQLVSQALKALDTANVSARMAMLETVLEQRPGDIPDEHY